MPEGKPNPGDVLVPPKKLGSLALTSAADVGGEYGLNLLVYGAIGTGKTTLTASAQDSQWGRDVLFIDLEGGTMSISDRKDIAVYRPMAWEDLIRVYKEIKNATPSPFQTIVVDSLSEVQKLAVKYIIGNKPVDQISQPDWGKANNNLLEMVRAFRELAHTKQINTIFTALERDTVNGQTGAIKTGIDLTPQSAKDVGAAMDMVGYLTWNPKSGKRILHLQGDGKFVAKVRQPKTGKLLPNAMENPSLGALLDALRGGTPIPDIEL
jgi:phage nucleotide-binding protein